MDDQQTRLARYESMRKGNNGRYFSENKKLFLVHMDLRKQCERSVRGYARDTQMAVREITRQQKLIQDKKEHLEKEMERFKKQSDTISLPRTEPPRLRSDCTEDTGTTQHMPPGDIRPNKTTEIVTGRSWGLRHATLKRDQYRIQDTKKKLTIKV